MLSCAERFAQIKIHANKKINNFHVGSGDSSKPILCSAVLSGWQTKFMDAKNPSYNFDIPSSDSSKLVLCSAMLSGVAKFISPQKTAKKNIPIAKFQQLTISYSFPCTVPLSSHAQNFDLGVHAVCYELPPLLWHIGTTAFTVVISTLKANLPRKNRNEMALWPYVFWPQDCSQLRIAKCDHHM